MGDGRWEMGDGEIGGRGEKGEGEGRARGERGESEGRTRREGRNKGEEVEKIKEIKQKIHMSPTLGYQTLIMFQEGRLIPRISVLHSM